MATERKQISDTRKFAIQNSPDVRTIAATYGKYAAITTTAIAIFIGFYCAWAATNN